MSLDWDSVNGWYTFLGASAGLAVSAFTIFDRLRQGPRVTLDEVGGWAHVYPPGSSLNLKGPEFKVRFNAYVHLSNEGEQTTVGVACLRALNENQIKNRIARPIEGPGESILPLGKNENRGYGFLFEIDFKSDWECCRYELEVTLVGQKAIKRAIEFKFTTCA